MDAREVAYKDIISSTFAAINGELFFQNKKFYHNCGRFYVANEKSKNTIESKKLKIIDAPYIHDLNKRIESDMQSEAYDSVITKSRTLIEEVLIFILEQKDFCRDKKWVHFFGPVNGKTKVDSFIGYAAHLGLIRGGTPSGLYC